MSWERLLLTSLSLMTGLLRNNMIDLHSHTTYSDGSDSVEELLIKAQSLGIELLSITDHNSVKAYYDKVYLNYQQYFKGNIIKGVEITTTYQGEIVEVLGYGYDLDAMNQLLEENVLTFENKQKKEYELLKKGFEKANFTFDINNIQYDPTKESARKHFYHEMMQYPENVERLENKSSLESSSKFTRQEVYNPSSPYYIDQSSLYPSLEKTVSMIHEAGGIALLAHLYIYKNAPTFRVDLLEIVSKFKLDGVECHYSTFTKEQREDLMNFCQENNLLKSGGSDYHGTRKPTITLGSGMGDLKVPENITEDWPMSKK